MRLSEALKDKLMDVRLRDKLIAEGKVTKKQVDDYIASLNDEEGKATYIEAGRKNKSAQVVSEQQ